MIEKSDEPLIAELAETMSVAQIADKWEVSYQQMYNFLYRRGIKAQKFTVSGRKTNRKRHTELMERIKQLALTGMPGKVIALKVKRNPEYVSKVMQGLGISATAEKRRIMVRKYKVAQSVAKRMEIPIAEACLLHFGWSRHKTDYAARINKKAAS